MGQMMINFESVQGHKLAERTACVLLSFTEIFLLLFLHLLWPVRLAGLYPFTCFCTGYPLSTLPPSPQHRHVMRYVHYVLYIHIHYTVHVLCIFNSTIMGLVKAASEYFKHPFLLNTSFKTKQTNKKEKKWEAR